MLTNRYSDSQIHMFMSIACLDLGIIPFHTYQNRWYRGTLPKITDLLSQLSEEQQRKSKRKYRKLKRKAKKKYAEQGNTKRLKKLEQNKKEKDKVYKETKKICEKYVFFEHMSKKFNVSKDDVSIFIYHRLI